MADQETAPSDTAKQEETADGEVSRQLGSSVQAVEPHLSGSTSKPKDDTPTDATEPTAKFARLRRVIHAYWAKKKWTLPITVVVLLALVLGVPPLRYLVLGTFVRNQMTVVVNDSKTNKPVSAANVVIGDVATLTDGHGKVVVRPKIGSKKLVVAKKYYRSFMAAAVVSWPSKATVQISLQPTGRQVPITLSDKITGKPLANVLVKAAETTVRTDKDGKATIVLPTTSQSQSATLTLAGYNTATATISVTDQVVAANSFSLTPAGRLYFLSNLSGKIDVVKTYLDGSGRQTVFAGTGSEDTQTTSLLASRDWKYLALLSKHDGSTQNLYLINTATDTVTNIDGGNPTATFNLVGWSNDVFVYQVLHSTVSNWQSGGQVLKSYDAASGKLYNIDQTQGEGTGDYDYGFTQFSTVYLLDNEIVYSKNWYSSGNTNHLTGKSDSLISVRPDGSNKHSIKDFPVPASAQYSYYVALTAYEPQAIYAQVPNGDGTNSYFEYEDSKLSAAPNVTDDSFNKPYPTYLQSPSGKSTFWSEVRDNKNSLFVGNDDAENAKQIASLSDYTPYGWYSDNYLLVSKNGSELYIMAADGSGKALKVTDYYKPQLTYPGYGGGYGGL